MTTQMSASSLRETSANPLFRLCIRSSLTISVGRREGAAFMISKLFSFLPLFLTLRSIVFSVYLLLSLSLYLSCLVGLRKRSLDARIMGKTLPSSLAKIQVVCRRGGRLSSCKMHRIFLSVRRRTFCSRSLDQAPREAAFLPPSTLVSSTTIDV